jgi:transposase
MLDWLQVNGCLADISVRKTVLYDFIEKVKPPKKICKIDQVFDVHGHAVIRFPSFLCDLNPSELSSAKLKNLIGINSVSDDIKYEQTSRIGVGSYFTNI